MTADVRECPLRYSHKTAAVFRANEKHLVHIQQGATPLNMYPRFGYFWRSGQRDYAIPYSAYGSKNRIKLYV